MTLSRIVANAAKPSAPEPMHSNPVIAEIMHQLHEAAAKDEAHARTRYDKRSMGFFLGRADAKRHMISVLAQMVI